MCPHQPSNRELEYPESPARMGPNPRNSTGLVAIDLGSLAIDGAMHEVGAPLSGIELHFVRRLR